MLDIHPCIEVMQHEVADESIAVHEIAHMEGSDFFM